VLSALLCGPAEGTGIDLDEGHAASHEHPVRPPAALLALEETGGLQQLRKADYQPFLKPL
jgi:hypothetical protein